MFNKNSKRKSDYQESIGKGTQISGDIKSENNFRLDGGLNGSLTTTAKVVMGKESAIEGDLTCESACIAGKVTGIIKVNGHLLIKSTAQLAGKITAGSLQVEDGGKVEAICKISKRNDGTVSLPQINGDKQIA